MVAGVGFLSPTYEFRKELAGEMGFEYGLMETGRREKRRQPRSPKPSNKRTLMVDMIGKAGNKQASSH